MSDERELLLAILAMDAYNREYGEGLFVEGQEVGTATFKTHIEVGVTDDIFADWQSAGFYAAAYDLPDGATVISYRGTDDARDVAHGWVMALGDVTDHTQASHALEFYEKVAQQALMWETRP